MGNARPEVEWFYDPATYWKEYGLICQAGMWAVVQATDFDVYPGFKLVTPYLNDRQTALGFLKLLKEK